MKTAGQMRIHLLAKATEDEEFREKLLKDPKAAISEELNMTLPSGFKVFVHEDTSDTTHLVLPPLARLSIQELQAVSGASWHATDEEPDQKQNSPQWWDVSPGA